MKVYLVGGAVRDKLLGHEVHDQDFVVVGATPKEMEEQGFVQVGSDFPVFLDEHGQEFALARQERKTGPGYNGFETNFDTNVTLEDDLLRRDLTINAMAVEVLAFHEGTKITTRPEIIDPFNGQADLKAGIIRHVSDAFAEDPVRVLRAARFAARFGFTIADDTKLLMAELAHNGDMTHLTAERVFLEFEKTMTDSADLFRFFEVLDEVDALKVIAPELVSTIHQVADLFDNDLHTVEERFAALTLFLLFDDVEAFYTRIKAPTNIFIFARKLNVARRIALDNDLTAEMFIELFTATDMFRNDMLSGLSTVFNATGDSTLINVADLAPMLFHDAALVSFDSLSVSEKSTLKGKDIGDRIAELRLAAVHAVLN